MTIQEQLDYIKKNLSSSCFDPDFKDAVLYDNYFGSYIEIKTSFFNDVNDKSLWLKYQENDQYFLAYEERGFVVNRIAIIKNQVNLYNGCYFNNSISDIDIEHRTCKTDELDTSLLFNLMVAGYGDFKACFDAYKLMLEMKDSIESTFREAGWS